MKKMLYDKILLHEEVSMIRLNKKLNVYAAITILALLIFSGLNTKRPEQTYAAGTYTTSLPSTINVTPLSDNGIRSYYSSLDSLATSERQGTNLLKNLKPILLDNFRYYSYTNTWKVLQVVDRNWELDPLSPLTGYTYSDNPYVRLLYRNDNDVIATAAQFNDTHGTYIDREHVWPQSRGFKASSGASGPAGTDVHHLMLADSYNNQQGHNNYPWGDEDDGITPTTIGSFPENTTGTRWTAIDEFGDSALIYEPQDSDKGNVARAIFYMAARYNNWAGETGVISDFEPFLIVTDEVYDNTTISSTDTTPAKMGVLSTLLKWHEMDPVDEIEIRRNNLIYNNYQLNRNPFIDFPEWVDAVYGSGVYATPSSDTINGYNESSVSITEITLSPSSFNLSVGGSSTTLVANITPTNASNKTLNWTSSNNSIATVDSSGQVSPVSVGTATITATATDGSGVYATSSVTVHEISERELDYIEVSAYDASAPYKGSYDQDSVVVMAHYDDFTTEDVTSSSTIDAIDTNTLGQQIIDVSYAGKSTSFIVEVTNLGASIGTSYATDLIISEYIEGSSNNKAIEIYNGTGSTVNLSNYRLGHFNNGSSTMTYDLALSGNLLHNDVFVIAHSSANDLIKAQADLLTAASAIGFNGNDVMVIFTGTKDNFNLIDVVGVIGSSSNFAIDTTLVRKSTVLSPVTTYDSSQWNTYSTDTSTYLGSHTMDTGNPADYADQAIAYAVFFLAETAPYCVLLQGDDVDWTYLSNEYGYMQPDSKNYFVAESTTNQSIVDAIERYEYLINKYASLYSNNFMEDGDGTPLIILSGFPNQSQGYNSVNGFAVLILITITILPTSVFLLIRRQKTRYNR
jgi:uncharacterized protein YjdB